MRTLRGTLQPRISSPVLAQSLCAQASKKARASVRLMRKRRDGEEDTQKRVSEGKQKAFSIFSTNYNNDDTHLKGFQFNW